MPNEGELTLQFEIKPAKGFKLSPEAEMVYLLETLPGAGKPWSETKSLPEVKAAFKVPVPAAALAGSKGLRVSLAYFECSDGSEGICRIKSQIWDIPLKLDPTAKERVIFLRAPSVATDDIKK